jgi:hypothetical protein
MLKQGIFKKYAIGGGIAGIFYIEPITTFDLDIFIIIEQKSKIITLTPIYDWLGNRGYKYKNEQIIIENIPVQFLPAYNPLVEEAVHNAKKTYYKNTETNVIKAEYLFAIMLQTYRVKDKERMTRFLDQAEMNLKILNSILEKHKLINKFNEFKGKYGIEKE